MLRQRTLTAIVLLLLLGAVLGSGSLIAFYLVLALFFGAACWESLRLLGVRFALPLAVVAAILLPVLADRSPQSFLPLALVCVLIWVLRFVPALSVGLPQPGSVRGTLFAAVYLLALTGCFLTIAGLYQRSVVALVSVLAIVWVADIGAYFAGRAFGQRKLAPNISPGKTWEGVAGGWVAVIVVAVASTWLPAGQDNFAQRLLQLGWPAWLLMMTVLVAASVIGDLFESAMKRQAGVKDSSQLLPGHGGVLDRIDALVPVMPLAFVVTARLT